MNDALAVNAAPEPKGDFRLGELRVFASAGRIEGPGGTEQVDPKVMAVLERLARDAGTPVSREMLLDSVWEGRIVSDDAISRCIYQLRRHLAAAGGGNRFRRLIRTLPKRGYVLQAAVAPLDDSRAPAAAMSSPSAHPKRGARDVALAALATLVLALGGGLAWWMGAAHTTGEAATTAAPAHGPPTVAVLPFADLSPGADQAWFADGISDEIIGLLASYRELSVIGRTSSFALRDSGLGSREISDLLGARFLLEGSVRKHGDALRISTQLVDRDGVHRWGATFDRRMEEVFDVQHEIARVVATNILPQVLPATGRARQPDLEAYREYLVGWDLLSRRADQYLDEAPAHFTRAIEIDPDFAAAHAARAIALFFRSRAAGDHDEQIAQAWRDVETAIALEPRLGKAYAAKALLMERTDPGNLAQREALLRRALEIDPGLPDAWNWLGGVLAKQGRRAESFEALRQGARHDPLAPAINVNLALGETPEEAIRRLERLLRLPRQSELVSSVLVDLYLGTGQYAKALAVAEQLMLDASSAAARTSSPTPLVVVYARLGMREQAVYWLERHAAEAPPSHFPAVLFTLYRARHVLGEAETLARYRAVLDEAGVEAGQLPLELRAAYGVLLSLAGEHDGAVEVLETNFENPAQRPELDTRDYHAARQALAWSLQQTGRVERARAILEAVDPLAGYAYFLAVRELGDTLAAQALDAVLLGDLASARRGLERAVAAGWRDPLAVAGDPRWDAARADPAVEGLLQAAAEDLHRQRREIEATREPGTLVAQLDAVIAVDRGAGVLRR